MTEQRPSNQVTHYYAGWPGKILCEGKTSLPVSPISSIRADHVTCQECKKLLAPNVEPLTSNEEFTRWAKVRREISCLEIEHEKALERIAELEKRLAEPPTGDLAIARNCLGNLYVAVENLGRVPSVPRDPDVLFAMREAAQFLGPPYTAVTKAAEPPVDYRALLQACVDGWTKGDDIVTPMLHARAALTKSPRPFTPMDREALREKIASDPDEGEIGVGGSAGETSAGHIYSPRPGTEVCAICDFHKREHAVEHMPTGETSEAQPKFEIELPDGDDRKITIWFVEKRDDGKWHISLDVESPKEAEPLDVVFQLRKEFIEWTEKQGDYSLEESTIFGRTYSSEKTEYAWRGWVHSRIVATDGVNVK